MTGGAPGPEIDLIRDSVESAGAKLRFFRIAFGAGGDQAAGLADAGRVAADGRRGGRAGIIWEAEGEATRSELRLAFLLILCIESALPLGGSVTVTRGDRWRIAGNGPTVRLEPTLWQALRSGSAATDLDAARVQFALAPAAASELGAALDVETSEGAVAISFRAGRGG